MTWLTWRQFRTQAVVAAALLAVIAVFLAVTGIQLAHQYDTTGLPGCRAIGDCAALASRFEAQLNSGSLDKLLYIIGTAVLFVVPGLTGIFWGAPLISRELEADTQRLAWTQSITRTRWLAVKLTVVGLASVAAAGLASLMLTWWASPIQHASDLTTGPASALSVNHLQPIIFGARGVVPLGYAAFAFALGVTASIIIRRTVPAMAVTLAIFAALQILIPGTVRPHLLPPARASVALTLPTLNTLSTATSVITNTSTGNLTVGDVNIPGAWVLSITPALTSAGQVDHGIASACQYAHNANACLAQANLHVNVTYQPASRFWPLQWCETAVYAALALLLAATCFWWVNRRLS
jgi:ABC-type transport system involved in multi-copper enzyme maturation permease subunit